MTRLTDREIDEIARRIAADMARGGGGQAAPSPVQSQETALGVFATVSDAVRAAAIAQKEFAALKLTQRARILEAMRQAMRENESVLAKAAFEETGLGRWEDKIVKNRLVTDKTPGLEDLTALATTGDNGLTLVESAPFGVIGAITPVTNPTSTIICNSIGMLAAGNSVVFNVHPYAKNCCMQTIALL
ncbi:MAG: aldehyde dehydrogenase family protein, partial [Thermoanaerobaculia bacterium]